MPQRPNVLCGVVMTKFDMIRRIAKETGVSKTDTRLVIEACMRSIKEAVAQGDQVHLRGFGTFLAKKRAARMSHHIQQQQKVLLPAGQVVRFKPSDAFLPKAKKNEEV